MEKEVNFGESLSEILSAKKMTPELLADALQFSRSTIYSWLSNETEIRLSRLLKVADYFACSLEFLIGRVENDPSSIFKVCPFSVSLRKVMKEKGMTTYKLIQTSHYSCKHLYNWAHGTDPQLSTLVKLAGLLDCTVDYLVGRE